ncbi:hypothetical protein TNCV_2726411 [Trichonephila clavipes]|nr:hypothetical protein TNCV_2726411 [Trichonephila clavipes]
MHTSNKSVSDYTTSRYTNALSSGYLGGHRNGSLCSGPKKFYTFTLGNSTQSRGELAGSKSTVQLLLHDFHGSKIRLTSRTWVWRYHNSIAGGASKSIPSRKVSPVQNPP